MATLGFDFSECGYTYDPELIYMAPNVGVRLRKTDAQGVYSSYGTCTPADLVTPAVPMDAVREFFGFGVALAPGSQGVASFQISYDGGDHWLWWDGVAWSPVINPTDFSTAEDVETNIATFPIRNTRILQVKIHLEPTSNGRGTPHIMCVWFSFEARFGFFEDLRRSLLEVLTSNLRIDLASGYTLVSDTDEVSVISPFEALEIQAVYNLSTDPGKGTNIYAYSIEPRKAKMIGVQSAGDNILIEFVGRCPVYLTADANYFYSEVPAIVLFMQKMEEYRVVSPGATWVDRNPAGKRARTRPHPMHRRGEMQIHCGAGFDLDSSRMDDAMRRILPLGRQIRSLATGIPSFQVVATAPWEVGDDLKVGIYRKSFTITLYCKDWSLREYREDATVDRIVFGLGDGIARDSDLTIQ